MLENQKKIWITGASSGIGKALAEKFAKKNWKVAISARRENLLNEIAQNKNISVYPLDITNQKETKNTFDKIINDFDGIDICVFCSAVYNRKSEKEIDVDQISKTIEVNFLGTVNCVKAVESYFKKKKDGANCFSVISCCI